MSENRLETTLAAIRADLERVGPRPDGPVSPAFTSRPENPLDEYIRRRVDELIRAWLRENLHLTVRELLERDVRLPAPGADTDTPT